jgi:hypothetical protein
MWDPRRYQLYHSSCIYHKPVHQNYETASESEEEKVSGLDFLKEELNNQDSYELHITLSVGSPLNTEISCTRKVSNGKNPPKYNQAQSVVDGILEDIAMSLQSLKERQLSPDEARKRLFAGEVLETNIKGKGVYSVKCQFNGFMPVFYVTNSPFGVDGWQLYNFSPEELNKISWFRPVQEEA